MGSVLIDSIDLYICIYIEIRLEDLNKIQLYI